VVVLVVVVVDAAFVLAVVLAVEVSLLPPQATAKAASAKTAQALRNL
jgi:hypothetical protein